MLKPRTVLFDWDNTLASTATAIQDAMNATLAHFGHPVWSAQDCQQRIQKSARDSLPQLFGDAWEEASALFYEHYVAFAEKNLTLLEGALDLLTLLKTLNVKMAVVSNKKSALVHQEIHRLHLKHFFSAIIGAGDAREDKPSPLPIYAALDQLEQPPGCDVWMVGDTPVDWESAHAAGCTAVAIGDYPRTSLNTVGLSVANCTELQKIFKKM